MNYDLVTQRRLDGSKAVQILIADSDEKLLAEYRWQAREGVEIITVCSGLGCIAQLRKHVPDVLVLEWELHWGGGDGVLAIMHEDFDLCIVPVMILTASREPMLLDHVSQYPVNESYFKPLRPVHLVNRVHALLYQHSHRRDVAKQNECLEHLIAKETGGRIHELRVETKSGAIIVHGRSETYHTLQLALAVVIDFLKSPSLMFQQVKMDIQVCGRM